MTLAYRFGIVDQIIDMLWGGEREREMINTLDIIYYILSTLIIGGGVRSCLMIIEGLLIK